MQNTISVNLSASYIEQELNRTTRFMDMNISHEPSAYQTGQIRLLSNESNKEINGINLIILKCNDKFSIKVGDTSNASMDNMSFFAYDGITTNIFLSNSSNDPIEIDFVSSQY